ncbi:MAG: cell division protein FtsZ [Bacteroidales bacterium]|nr:cell division protein FtsZ [Bacteroidales bacterium]
MEDNLNTDILAFDSPKEQSSYIKVIGVGGGGGNAVNHMFRQGIKGVDFIVCNTDMKALNASPIPNKISLGNLGAGNKPERARQAALDHSDDIREVLSHNTQMLFITAGMGGGTGTGAAPVIAEIAKNIDLDNEENRKILVVAIVTKPFSFEGKRRLTQAEEGIKELRKHVDSIIVINNDKLRSFGNLTMSQAFAMADDVLLTAAKGIAEIITLNAYIGTDFQDVNTVMENSGTALMGTGSGRGENRALDAIQAATTSVLLDDSDIRGAKNVLLYFSYSSEHEITMDEQSIITDYLLDKTDSTADMIWGAGADDSLGDELKVILIATGFEAETKGKKIEYLETYSQPKENNVPVGPAKPIEQRPKEAPIASDKTRVFTLEAEDKPHVFVLEDDPIEEEKDAPKAITETKVETPTSAAMADDPWEDLVLVSSKNTVAAPAPTIEHKPEVSKPADVPQAKQLRIEDTYTEEAPIKEAFIPKETYAPSTPDLTTLMTDVTERADRIRILNSILKNNPNGAYEVGRMSTQSMLGQEVYAGSHSSEYESSATSIRSDGSVVSALRLRNNPPD